MKKLYSIFLLSTISLSISAQTFNSNYAEVSNAVSQANINTYLQEFQNLGVKTSGSTANNNALDWLKTKYKSFGYIDSQIVEDPFSFSGKSTSNLVITKTGTKYPNTYVIICGHYDTLNGPGANDNGSGVSVILEIARLLKDIPTEYSIRFINFSGEEQGLLGSQHYVTNVVNATNPKMDIKLVFNIDEVGGVKGKTNDTITCEKDTSNPSANNTLSNTYTQELMTCVALYSPLKTYLANAYSSDYMPFQNNGETITGFFEYNETSYAHTENDKIENLDPVYIYNVAKAATGAVQHFAVATQTLSTENLTSYKNNFKSVPNPAKNQIEVILDDNANKNFTFTINSLDGKVLLTKENQTKIDTSHLAKGVYIGTLSSNNHTSSTKIIIE